MRGNSVILRRFLLRRQLPNLNSVNLVKTLISPSTAAPSSNGVIPGLPLSRNYISTCSSGNIHFHQFQRTLCSSPDGPSNIVLIKSGEEFNSSLGKVKDESLPAIFYFTAAWCGPCKFLVYFVFQLIGRFISPVIAELSAKHPHVTTYKIDIDQEGLGSTLSKLNISAVPTLLFFHNGEKAAEIVGADVSKLKDTMEKLYKKD
ncbi:Thioredoxin [Melia azedarach]|uniref:Thioredoxin n=1 Tax=Melia azedarach TaxID=155640 RepID=A0ACC1WUJ1_MELAZ|nr:Thioredoxin [Melia azedarach]